jgi:Txe/YoeB family toxin of Txe-Axe toxin-antitoxin module
MDKEFYVAFIDSRVKKSYDSLKTGRSEESGLHERINHAIDSLKKDPSYGIRIPHDLIPGVYIKKHGIDNLRKINLPDGWRLLYTVKAEKEMIVSVIIEWLSHTDYERRVGY